MIFTVSNQTAGGGPWISSPLSDASSSSSVNCALSRFMTLDERSLTAPSSSSFVVKRLFLK